MSVELLPCPFCGSTNVDTEVVAPHTHKIATFMPDYQGGAMACCYNCNTANWRDGPDAERVVIELWNTRAPMDKGPQPFVCTGDEIRCFDGNGCECELAGRKEPSR